jgi:hypothetical protein
MDPTTAIRTDTLPAIGTIVAPGACVSAPYLWAFVSPTKVVAFIDRHEAISVLLGLFVCVTAGLFVESVGSYVEYYLIDLPKENRAEILDDWWHFLRTKWPNEPVGLHYLRRILVSFKFELNTCVAAFGTIPGIVILGFRGVLGSFTVFGLVTVSLIVSALMFNMADTSAGILADVRKQLLRGVSEPSIQP